MSLEGDTSCTQMTPVSQPQKTEEDPEDDEDEEILPHIPGSFDFEDHDGVAAQGHVSVPVRCYRYTREFVAVDSRYDFADKDTLRLIFI